jgi:hypothetical protein
LITGIISFGVSAAFFLFMIPISFPRLSHSSEPLSRFYYKHINSFTPWFSTNLCWCLRCPFAGGQICIVLLFV